MVLSVQPSYIGGVYVVLLFIMVFSAVYMIKALILFLLPPKKEQLEKDETPAKSTPSTGYFELRGEVPKKRKRSPAKKRERALGKLYFIPKPPEE